VRVLTALDRDSISELRQRDEFFWLDLESPSDADLDGLRELFGLHPLVLEDLHKFDQRPKLDDYEDYVVVVFYGVRVNGAEPEPIEVHVLVSGGYVITVRRLHCEQLMQLRQRLEGGKHEKEQFIIYRIFDTLTDSFFPVLAAVDDEIDALEDGILVQPTDEQLHSLFGLKKSLVNLRRVVSPQRDLFARAIDEIVELRGLEPATRDYFRDVYDHLIRISEQIDTYRDLLTGAMDVYLSTVSNRLNAVMKQLTIVSTIFLPLTFVTGFFGQNFGWMVSHVDTLQAFLTFGAGGLIVPLVLLLAWFKRSHYI
jgi:magnesium transporter